MLKKSGYTLGAIFLFLSIVTSSFWLNLSSKNLTPWIQHQINIQLPSEYQISIEGTSTSPMELNMEHIEIFKKNENQPIFLIQKFHFDLNLFKVLFNLGIPYNIELYEGQIEGVFKFFPEFSISFNGQGLQPNRNRALRKTNLILSDPIMDLQGKMILSESPEGKINFTLKETKLSGKPGDTGLPLELPDIVFSSTSANVKIQAQRISATISTKGDFNAKLSGTLLINQKQFQSSNINFRLVGDFSGTYNSELQALGFINSILDSYRKPSGTISINITGTPGAPNIKRI